MMAFMRAMMTFGRVEIQEAEARLKHAMVSQQGAVVAWCCRRHTAVTIGVPPT